MKFKRFQINNASDKCQKNCKTSSSIKKKTKNSCELSEMTSFDKIRIKNKKQKIHTYIPYKNIKNK